MRAGRDPGDVTLVAVSKTVGVDMIREAVDAGVRVFGESRVQEARIKAVGFEGRRLCWHMIGHLQKNKARAAVGMFDLIHSVDSLELAKLIDRCAGEAGKTQRVLVEVKLSEEEAKHGVAEGALEGLVKEASRLENIKVEGLMTMTPFFEDPELSRPYYRRLRGLGEGLGLRELSMGMSGDFDVAVEEGATLVRVGTALFGERPTRK